MSDIEYAIIGGGAIGRSVAYTLSLRGHAEIAVLERSPQDRIENQSTRNSGVIHAGIYYQKSNRPRKASLCVEGNELLYRFCSEHRVPHAKTGKLIVATAPEEEEDIHRLYHCGLDNQVPGLAIVGPEAVSALEPNVVATLALHVPSSGILDAAAYVRALQSASAAHSLFGTEVTKIEKVASGFRVHTRCQGRSDDFVARRVINAAGLYADGIARMINPRSEHEITPVRGEAAKFYTTRRADLMMRGMHVYPLPRRIRTSSGKEMETLGVHLTPTLDREGGIASTVTIGPAIGIPRDREDYGTNLHPAEYYWEQVHEFFPNLRVSDIELHQSGIQARCAASPDWVMEPDPIEPDFINLIGIDSPGLTASLAIARDVVDTFLAG